MAMVSPSRPSDGQMFQCLFVGSVGLTMFAVDLILRFSSA